MEMYLSSIFGCNVGFEFLPLEMCEEFGGMYGILFDLAFFRVMFIRMQPE